MNRRWHCEHHGADESERDSNVVGLPVSDIQWAPSEMQDQFEPGLLAMSARDSDEVGWARADH